MITRRDYRQRNRLVISSDRGKYCFYSPDVVCTIRKRSIIVFRIRQTDFQLVRGGGFRACGYGDNFILGVTLHVQELYVSMALLQSIINRTTSWGE